MELVVLQIAELENMVTVVPSNAKHVTLSV